MRSEENLHKTYAFYIFFLGIAVNLVGFIASINAIKIITGSCFVFNTITFLLFCIKLKKYYLYSRLTMTIIGIVLLPLIFMLSITPDIAVLYNFIMPCIYMVTVKRKRDMVLPLLNGLLLAVLVYMRLGLEYSVSVFFIFAFCVFLGSLFSKSLFSAFNKLELAYDFVSDLSKKDKLTGLFNRYGLEEALKIRSDSPCFAIMIDIDFFKNVNDTYGHDAGDKVLFMLGEILTRYSGRYFLVSRMGGEEFLLVSYLGSDETFMYVEKIFASVRNELIIEGQHVNISCGISKNGIMEDALIKEADSNLYRSKNTGRNKCSYKMRDVVFSS